MTTAIDALRAQPADRALALPAVCYVDAEYAQRERERVFGHSWQLVAHAVQLSTSGDHVLAEAGGVPLAIVRGEPEAEAPQGRLRALHNVCRHRAGPLIAGNGRGARALTCRYHGWTYALDGCLIGAPEMHDAPAFDRAEVRLPQADVAEWQGLVFASVGNPGPLAQLVADIDERLPAPFADWRFDRRVSYEIGCNWKVYVDNYLEGYHLARVHPTLNEMLDYRNYRTELFPGKVLQASPLAALQGVYGGSEQPNEARYWWLWPNTMLNVLPDRLQTNRVMPLAVDRCRVDFDYFYAPHASATLLDRDQTFADQVQAEDIAICEAVQRGLASSSYVTGRLNPARETGVHHFHELLRQAYGH